MFEYRGHISPPRDWDRWGGADRALGSATSSSGTASTRSRGGASRSGTSRTSRSSGPARRRSTSASTRSRRGRSSRSTSGCVSAARPPPPRAGSPTSSTSSSSTTCRSTSSRRTPTGTSRSTSRRSGSGGLDDVIWWTEWGVTPTHFYDVTDSRVRRAVRAARDEERAGRSTRSPTGSSATTSRSSAAPALLHGGFGLMTVGNLRKPRWWALALAEQLGDELLDAELTGDGAGSLVDMWVTRHDDGGVDVLVWNGSLEQAKADGDPLLDRTRANHRRGPRRLRRDARAHRPRALEPRRPLGSLARLADRGRVGAAARGGRLDEEPLGVLDPRSWSCSCPCPASRACASRLGDSRHARELLPLEQLRARRRRRSRPTSTRSTSPSSVSARIESAPPTTVKASSFRATASATARVPSAKRGHSNTPIGPFQKGPSRADL